MGSPSPSPHREYWYFGSQERDAEDLLSKACALAWPYARYCALRYLHDGDAAYDLMDAAVANTERYCRRHQEARTPTQIFARMLSTVKRLSIKAAGRRREIYCGTLSDLDLFAKLTSTPDVEQAVYASEVFASLSERSRSITMWRIEGYTWRQIARKLGSHHSSVQYKYNQELRKLLKAASNRKASDQS